VATIINRGMSHLVDVNTGRPPPFPVARYRPWWRAVPRESGEYANARCQATHPSRTLPGLVAPNRDKRDWDITKTARPVRHLLRPILILDIYCWCGARWWRHRASAVNSALQADGLIACRSNASPEDDTSDSRRVYNQTRNRVSLHLRIASTRR